VSHGGTNAYLMVAAVHTCFHSPPSTHLVVTTVNACFYSLPSTCLVVTTVYTCFLHAVCAHLVTHSLPFTPTHSRRLSNSLMYACTPFCHSLTLTLTHLFTLGPRSSGLVLCAPLTRALRTQPKST
jgi:hypothetical protein